MGLPSPTGSAPVPLPSMRRHLLHASLWLPVLVLLASVFHAWRSNFSVNILLGQSTMFLFSAFLARFMWRRAYGMEAKFFATRITSDESTDVKEIVDRVSLVVAAVFLACAVFMPYALSWAMVTRPIAQSRCGLTTRSTGPACTGVDCRERRWRRAG